MFIKCWKRRSQIFKSCTDSDWEMGRGGDGLLSHAGGLLPGKGAYFRRFGSLPFYLRSMTFPIAHPNEQKTTI